MTTEQNVFIKDNLSIDTHEVQYFCFTVNPTLSNAASSIGSDIGFKAALAWIDPEASMSARFFLINNLDLIVENAATGQVILGNSKAFDYTDNTGLHTNWDSMNNMEYVSVNITSIKAAAASAAANPVAGTPQDGLARYLVAVRGANVPNGPQHYSLVVTGAQSLVSNDQCVGSSPSSALLCPNKCGGSASIGTCVDGICQCAVDRTGADCSVISLQLMQKLSALSPAPMETTQQVASVSNSDNLFSQLFSLVKGIFSSSSSFSSSQSSASASSSSATSDSATHPSLSAAPLPSFDSVTAQMVPFNFQYFHIPITTDLLLPDAQLNVSMVINGGLIDPDLFVSLDEFPTLSKYTYSDTTCQNCSPATTVSSVAIDTSALKKVQRVRIGVYGYCCAKDITTTASYTVSVSFQNGSSSDNNNPLASTTVIVISVVVSLVIISIIIVGVYVKQHGCTLPACANNCLASFSSCSCCMFRPQSAQYSQFSDGSNMNDNTLSNVVPGVMSDATQFEMREVSLNDVPATLRQ
jgi:hypothetical protein